MSKDLRFMRPELPEFPILHQAEHAGMAEIVGTVASIVTLFKVCIKGFEFVRDVQQHDVELRKLTIRLGIEHARLYTWGQAMGLTQKRDEQPNNFLIDDSDFRQLILSTLQLIVETLSDSEKTRAKYGCQKVQAGLEHSSQPLDRTSACSVSLWGSVGIGGKSLTRKAVWAIVDQKKFKGLIQDARELIDGLQDITKNLSSSARQQQMLKSHIRQIGDILTLESVSEVCKEPYPEISDTASACAETLSSLDGRRLTILDWTQTLEDVTEDDEDDDCVTLEEVEAMNIADLKRHCISLIHSNRRLQLALRHVADADAVVTMKDLQEVREIVELEISDIAQSSMDKYDSRRSDKTLGSSDKSKNRARVSEPSTSSHKNKQTSLKTSNKMNARPGTARSPPSHTGDASERQSSIGKIRESCLKSQIPALTTLYAFYNCENENSTRSAVLNSERNSCSRRHLTSEEHSSSSNADNAWKALQAINDEDFRDELQAVSEWVRVSSPAESVAIATVSLLGAALDRSQIHFLNEFLSYCAQCTVNSPPYLD